MTHKEAERIILKKNYYCICNDKYVISKHNLSIFNKKEDNWNDICDCIVTTRRPFNGNCLINSIKEENNNEEKVLILAK